MSAAGRKAARQAFVHQHVEIQMTKKLQRGFTLIELMIVVAIIGILAAIAIPAYQDYVIRSQVSEGLTLASSVKASVSEFYADRGVWPDDDGSGTGDLGLTAPPSGKYVTGIDVNAGTIVITYGNQANQAIGGETLSLKPLLSPNQDVVWQCGSHAIGASIATEASGSASGAVDTSIAGKYRPSNCR
jgi:type IV pilus assembly protein PilA